MNKYFVVAKQYGEGCDYTIGCGIIYLEVEAEDELDIFNQLKEEYNGERALELIYYTELTNMKTINIEEMIKRIKPKCKHEKVYSNVVLCTYPAKRSWICSKCGEQGYDLETIRNISEYDKLIRKFNR